MISLVFRGEVNIKDYKMWLKNGKQHTEVPTSVDLYQHRGHESVSNQSTIISSSVVMVVSYSKKDLNFRHSIT